MNLISQIVAMLRSATTEQLLTLVALVAILGLCFITYSFISILKRYRGQ